MNSNNKVVEIIDTISDMNKHIKDLESELITTNKRVASLISENIDLKLKLTEYKVKNNGYY